MARFVLTAELQLRAPTNTAAVLATIQRQLQGLTANVTVTVNRQSINQINSINRSIRQTRREAADATDAFEAFGKQAALAVRRFGAFVTATFAFRQLVSSIISGVKEAIAFERQVIKIAQVTNSAIRDMKDLSGEVTRLSTTLGVSSTKLIESAQVLAQAGLSAKETKTALDALAKSELSPTFDDITETTEGAIAIFQQFGKEAKDLEGILGSLNAVSGKFAVESSDLITAVRRTGGAFKAAGGNLDELSALFTSVRATTRESAESIATGFRTIFTRIQRPRTVNFLRELGVELTDLKGQFVGPLEAVRRLSLALEKIPSTDIRFAQVIEELGGFRQVSKVIPLIQQFAISEKALAVAQTGRNSLTEDATKAQASLSVQIQKVREEFGKLIRDFTDDTTFRNLVDLSLKLASSLIKVVDAIRPLAPALAVLGTVGLGGAASKALGSFGGGKGFLGNIFKFARGGKVPGHGTGDTVPAMLEPGEFVLRKQAVQAIGEDNISKFNKGGYVKAYAQGSPGKFIPITDQILKTLGIDTDSARFKKAGVTRDQILSSNQSVFEGAVSNLQTAGGTLGSKLKKAAFVPQNKAQKIGSKQIVQKGQGGRNITIGDLSGEPLFGGLFLRPIQDRNLSQVAQTQFATLPGTSQKALANQLGVSQASLQSSKIFSKLDFGFIESRTAKRFEVSGRRALNESVRSLVDKFSPTSSSIPNSVISSAVKTSNLDGALGSLFEAFTVSLSNISPTDRGKQANFDIADAKSSRGPLSRLFGDIPPSVLASDLKLSASKESASSIVRKAVKYIVDNGMTSIAKVTTAGIEGNIISPRSGQAIRPLRRASGGPSGKDTQPALLTPGEFVLNKEAVDRIGVPTLNKMNKVQKLNKGGVVGKYASGGLIDRSFSGGGLLAGSVLLQVTSSFASLNESSAKLVGAISSAAIQAAIFSTAMKQSSFVTERATKLEAANSALDKQKDVRRRLGGEAGAATARVAARTAVLNRQLTTPGAPAITQDQFDDLDRLREQRRRAVFRRDVSRRRVTQLETARDTAAGQLTGANLRAVGFGAGAAVGSVAGDFLAQRGTAAIQAGSTDRTQSAVGGTLSGAAQGALIGGAIGSAVPVIGTAVGALVGAIVGGTTGLVTSLSDASNQIKAVQFGKTVEQFNLSLKRGILGTNVIGSSTDINAGLNTIAQTIQSSTGEDRVAAEGAAKSALPDLQAFFDTVAKSSQTFEEFQQKAGRDTINLFSLFSKIPVDEVNQQYRKQIESQAAALKAQQNLTKATDEFAIRIKNTTAISRALSDATASLEGFSQTLLSDGTGGAQDISGILGNAGNVADQRRFESLTRGTGRGFGQAGAQAANDSIVANKVLTELPSVLLSLKNIDLFSEEAAGNFEDILKDRLSAATGNDPNARSFINIVGARAGGIIGGEGKPQKLLSKLNQDFEGTVKELGGGLEFAAELVQKEFKAVADSGKLISDGFARVSQLTIDSIDNFNAALDIQQDIDEFKQSLVPNTRFSAGIAEKTIRDQLGRTTSSLGTSSVSGLSSLLQSAQSGLIRTREAGSADSLAARVDKEGISIGEADRQNREQGAKFAEQAALAAKALGQIVTSSQKLAAAKQKELDAVEAERKSRLSLAEEFAFGGPEARLDIIENQNLVNRISSGAVSVQQLDPASRQRFGQFLDKLNPNTILANGQNAGQFKQDLVGQLTIGQLPLPGQPGQFLDQQGFKELTTGSPEEEKLRGEIVAAREQARDAQNALAEAPQKLAQQIEVGIAASIKLFDDSINKLIAVEQARFQKQADTSTAADKAAAANANKLKENVSSNLGFNIATPQDVNKARQLSADIGKIDQQKNVFRRAGTFREKAGQILNNKDFDENQKRNALLAEAQSTFGADINLDKFRESSLFKGTKSVAVSGGEGGASFIDEKIGNQERLSLTTQALSQADAKTTLNETETRLLQQSIDQLSATYGVNATQADLAAEKLAEINKQLEQLSQAGTIAFQQKAAGGLISGPNIRRDIMPAMLTPGEFVMRRDAVNRIGLGTLTAMNSGNIAGFASGGFVDPEEFKRQLLARKAEQDAKNEAAKQAATQNAASSKAASAAAKVSSERIVQQRQAEKAAEFKANQIKNKSIVANDLAAKEELGDGLTIQQKAVQARNRMSQLDAQQRGKELMGAFKQAGGGAAQGTAIRNTTPFGSPSSGFSASSRTRTVRSIERATRDSNRNSTVVPAAATSGAVAPVAVANTTRTSGVPNGQGQPQGGGQSSEQLQKIVGNFSATVDKFSQALEKFNGMKFEHSINGKVEVIINGDSALNKLSEDFQNMVLAKVSQGINEQVIKPLNLGGKANEVNFSNLGKR